uniref:Transmembrane and coiled-coil domain family 3 n=2 Tax=Callorhinchus milii TaxID=7868 RepID=V9KT86_CALMI|eukprot:gi/632980722/ref/XP_007907193.1/ PREDICTED: transmembrane and coiled-coil domains protein 3 [Callorhinchus milii]
MSAEEWRIGKAERTNMSSLSLPGNIRRGGSDTNLNLTVTDGFLDFQRERLSAEQLKQKVLKITEQIRIEQVTRDDNVAEYLKLVNNADKQQSRRIKQVFEKKNQKSAHTITQLQKKLEHYHKKMKDVEQNGPKTSKESLKDSPNMVRDINSNARPGSGAGILEGGKGVPGVTLTPPTYVFNKSREFANLIRNKFGSADNISHLKTSSMDDFRRDGGSRTLGGSATLVSKDKYLSDEDDDCSNGSASGDSNGNSDFGLAATGSPKSSTLEREQGKLSTIFDELKEIKDAQTQLSDDIEKLKVQFKRDYALITQALQEERYRSKHLEDQLNDLTELHQHETIDLKQELASIEEKVTYQSYERARDIQEALESCQTRIATLELHHQQQQVVQIEHANAKVLLAKCINVLLAIMTVILVCVSTIAKFSVPLLKSRFHVLCTVCSVLLIFILWKKWDDIQCLVEHIIVSR